MGSFFSFLGLLLLTYGNKRIEKQPYGVAFCLTRLYTLSQYNNMRKITQEAIRAFMNRQNFKKSNTQVMAHNDGWTGLFLHDNLIAEIVNYELIINDGGWQSNTTKERLNGLPHVNIVQKNFQWYLNGYAWNGEKVNVCRMIY